MKKRLISVVLISLFAVSLFTSCSKDTGENKSIVYPIDNDPVYLDPQIAADSGARSIINNCFEGLVRLDENNNIVPAAAEKWKISKDKKTYTFYLREDNKWLVTKTASKTIDKDKNESYEIPLTADDFVFAFRRALSSDTKAPDAKLLYSINNAKQVNRGSTSSKNLGVKKVNDYEIKITLSQPDDDFLSVLTKAICMPCNEEFFNLTKGRYGLSAQYLIYNGPFFISSWQENTSLTISRNESYSGDHRAKPQSVFFSMNNEYDTRAKKLLQETYDISPLIYSQYTQVKDEKGYSFIENQNTVWALVFNCKDEYMKNLNARLAVCRGFDKEKITQSEGVYTEAQGVIPQSALLNGETYRKNAGEVKTIKYDIKKAESYWDSALSELEKSAMSITIKCSAKDENSMRAVLQNLQKAFGISCDVRVSSLSESELLSDFKSGNYQIAYVPITAESEFATDFIEQVASSASYSSKEFDTLISKIRGASSNNKLGGIINAEEHLIQNGIIVPIYEEKSYIAMRKDVSAVYSNASGETLSFFNVIKF